MYRSLIPCFGKNVSIPVLLYLSSVITLFETNFQSDICIIFLSIDRLLFFCSSVGFDEGREAKLNFPR